MKNRIVINIAAFVLTAVISVAISIVSALIAEGFTEKLNTISAEGTDGAQIAAYSIEELPGLNEVRYVNYTADEFLSPRSEISGEVIDLNQHPYFEGKGTLQFVFKGLDSSDNDFNDKSQALAPYLRGDNAWHFTLYLPAMTGAVNIYVGTKFYRLFRLRRLHKRTYIKNRTVLHRPFVQHLFKRRKRRHYSRSHHRYHSLRGCGRQKRAFYGFARCRRRRKSCICRFNRQDGAYYSFRSRFADYCGIFIRRNT